MKIQKKDNTTFAALVVGCLGVLLVIGIIAGVSALFGWLTQILLRAAFHIEEPLWVCMLGWFLANSLFSAARSSSGSGDKS